MYRNRIGYQLKRQVKTIETEPYTSEPESYKLQRRASPSAMLCLSQSSGTSAFRSPEAAHTIGAKLRWPAPTNEFSVPVPSVPDAASLLLCRQLRVSVSTTSQTVDVKQQRNYPKGLIPKEVCIR
ncbi:hypothetical protein E4U51_006319 [Claviceps purpurea]|nr:hypothetical protein E4U51_006319 [Claviceps purpurea]